MSILRKVRKSSLYAAGALISLLIGFLGGSQVTRHAGGVPIVSADVPATDIGPIDVGPVSGGCGVGT